MFQSISWNDYFSTLLFLIAVYYVAIAYLYYRRELLNVVGIKRLEPNSVSATTVAEFSAMLQPPSGEEYAPKQVDDIDITPVVQSFIGEVEAYMEEAAANKIIKQEILYALQQISAKYPVFKTGDYRISLIQDVYRIANGYFPGIFKPQDFKLHLFS